MCLAILALDAHPRYAVAIAANRDEFHARPTEAARWQAEGWLGGRDRQAGGTWLGVTAAGRYALVTNVREPARNDPHAPTRGNLVPHFLASRADPEAAIEEILRIGAACNGFNLIGGDATEAVWGSNRKPRPAKLATGLHGLSNASLDTPWPKVEATKAAVAKWCGAAAEGDIATLFAALAEARVAPDERLPATGVPLEWERRLSASFIISDNYGTRSSTVLLIAHDGAARFVERSFDAQGRASGEIDIAFALAKS